MSLGGGGSAKKSDSTTETKQTEAQAGIQTTQLELQQEAIDKIIQDVLGGESGLASIFSGEQNAGIFDSSVASQASGDLVAQLVGELAKLTGKTTVESATSTSGAAKNRTENNAVEANADFSLF